ncbi:MAG: metallophosphoesterase [bacterium]|nr:metallophosphoesterase [bacterium]
MKAFVFSDLHAQSKQLYNLEHFFDDKNDIDLLIFAGDVVNMGEPVGFIVNFIEVIEKNGLPFFWVPGNNDFGRSYHKLNAKYPSLEGRIVELSDPSPLRGEARWGVNKINASNITPPPAPPRRGGEHLKLTGVGGSPASWSGQYAGEKMIDKKSIAGSIFVSHVPPPGILVMNKYDWENPNTSVILSEAKNLRDPSSASRRTQDDNKTGRRFSDAPLVHICGHQHSRWGCGYLGQTKVINPGSLADGRYVIISLGNLKVEFWRFT